MKNRLSLVLMLLALVLVVGGCSLGGLMGGDETSDSGSKSEESSTKDTAKKSSSSSESPLNSGIESCDELAKFVNDNEEEIESTWTGKALLLAYKNYVLTSIEDGIEKMDDEGKKKLDEVCTKTLKELKENGK